MRHPVTREHDSSHEKSEGTLKKRKILKRLKKITSDRNEGRGKRKIISKRKRSSWVAFILSGGGKPAIVIKELLRVSLILALQQKEYRVHKDTREREKCTKE